MDINATIIIGALLISLVVGNLTGIFGVGGGFLLTPALMILLGVPGPIAVGTGLAAILITSTIAIVKRRGSNTLDLKLALLISIGSMGGVYLGQLAMERLKHMPALVVLGREHDAVEYCLLCGFLLLLIFIAMFLYFDYHKNQGQAPAKRVGLFARVPIGPFMKFSSLEEPRLSVSLLIALGILIGVLTGLMGIGGGVVWLPALIYLVGQRTVKAAGTSLILVWISSLGAVTLHIMHNNVSFPLWAIMLVGGMVGTHYGTKIGLFVSGPKLRLYFIYVVLVAVALISFKLYMLTF